MTEQELCTIPFRMTGHASWKDEHTSTYSSEDGKLGFCVHTKMRNGIPGRTYRHWRIGCKVYKTFDAFLKALEKYNPNN